MDYPPLTVNLSPNLQALSNMLGKLSLEDIGKMFNQEELKDYFRSSEYIPCYYHCECYYCIQQTIEMVWEAKIFNP